MMSKYFPVGVPVPVSNNIRRICKAHKCKMERAIELLLQELAEWGPILEVAVDIVIKEASDGE